MKSKEVAVGMKVAVNSLDEGSVYTVEGVDGFNATLSLTEAGTKRSVGSIDIGSLKRPTETQLRNAA
ncbi:hypothetical protein [Pandoraea sp. PE-S2T-3]|uniref:hypothetical protein n=1 Tax=Pandoraea sp. PE-S2T-3 TaxID=1986993 RepID=UPI000B3FF382|nr:hypothetical protein [Pandoraea sp. PE-S2T-3]